MPPKPTSSRPRASSRDASALARSRKPGKVIPAAAADDSRAVAGTVVSATAPLATAPIIDATKSYMLFAKGKPHPSLVWSKVEETGLLCAVADPLVTADFHTIVASSVAAMPQDEWALTREAGAVDFFPARRRTSDNRHTTVERYASLENGKEMIDCLLATVKSRIPFTKWSVFAYWGRIALRVIVPKDVYHLVPEVARDLELQFERVSPSPISVAKLVIRNVSGNYDEIAIHVNEAQRKVRQLYNNVSWGKVEGTSSETSFLVYIAEVLTIKDHFATLKDGIRTVFTTSFTERNDTESIMKAVDQITTTWVRVDHLSDSDSDCADQDMAAPKPSEEERQADKTLSIDFINEAIDAARKALKKTALSWNLLRLPHDLKLSALDVLDKKRNLAMADRTHSLHDSADMYAAWLNSCPTPADIARFTADEQEPEFVLSLAALQKALSQTQTPKADVLKELGGSRTYAAAAAASAPRTRGGIRNK